MKKKIFKGVGRRKQSIAQVALTKGTGKITVNGVDVREFFPYETNVLDLKQPLVLTQTAESVNLDIKVSGGGFNGQAGAARLGIARALLEYDSVNEDSEESFRKLLKKAGFLTRDDRKKERKKPGLKKARKAPQFSKR